MRYLLIAIALALASNLYAGEPPAAPASPPAAPAYKPVPEFTAKPKCGCEDCKCPEGFCPNRCPVAKTADPRLATVCVYGDMGNGLSSRGTGTVIASENGELLVVTNAHVITCSRMSVTYQSDGKTYITPAECIAKSDNKNPDLALLIVKGNLPAVEIAAEIPAVGTPVFLYGFGGTQPDNLTAPTRKDGKVTVNWLPGGWMLSDPTTRHTSHLIQGDSGSGLFDSAGKLIGVNHGVEKETGVAQAVRVDVVHSFTVATLKTKRVLFPKLHDLLAARKVAKTEADPPAAAAKSAPQPDAKHPANSYEGLCRHVAKGGKGVLYLGVPHDGWDKGIWAKVDKLEGNTPGIYDCYLEKDGTQMMRIRPGSSPLKANPFQTCPNGKCPNQR